MTHIVILPNGSPPRFSLASPLSPGTPQLQSEVFLVYNIISFDKDSMMETIVDVLYLRGVFLFNPSFFIEFHNRIQRPVP